MTRKTGWPQEMFLMQDDCSKLSRWFASRIDARETVRRVFRKPKEDMTREDEDDLFEMARQSHLDVYALGRDKYLFLARLEAFAKQIEDASFKRWAAMTKQAVDSEREACAKEADYIAAIESRGVNNVMLRAMAASIRARGQQ